MLMNNKLIRKSIKYVLYGLEKLYGLENSLNAKIDGKLVRILILINFGIFRFH